MEPKGAVDNATFIVNEEAKKLQWHPLLVKERWDQYAYEARGWWARLPPTERDLYIQQGTLILGALLVALIEKIYKVGKKREKESVE